jgi:hypothetical protein
MVDFCDFKKSDGFANLRRNCDGLRINSQQDHLEAKSEMLYL